MAASCVGKLHFDNITATHHSSGRYTVKAGVREANDNTHHLHALINRRS
jgi:hypothetical protein